MLNNNKDNNMNELDDLRSLNTLLDKVMNDFYAMEMKLSPSELDEYIKEYSYLHRASQFLTSTAQARIAIQTYKNKVMKREAKSMITTVFDGEDVMSGAVNITPDMAMIYKGRIVEKLGWVVDIDVDKVNADWGKLFIESLSEEDLVEIFKIAKDNQDLDSYRISIPKSITARILNEFAKEFPLILNLPRKWYREDIGSRYIFIRGELNKENLIRKAKEPNALDIIIETHSTTKIEKSKSRHFIENKSTSKYNKCSEAALMNDNGSALTAKDLFSKVKVVQG